MRKPDQTDNEILNLINASKLELGNIHFEDKCMRLIRQQQELDSINIAYYRKSFRLYIISIIICAAIICFSLIAQVGNIIYPVFLQAFSIAVACYIVIQIRSRVRQSPIG